jgi:hypothetical protein
MDSNRLSASAEYALILAAGAGAAASLAAQQAAAASVPITALVALGLLNRHRLDEQVKGIEQAPALELENQVRQGFPAQSNQVMVQPTPEGLKGGARSPKLTVPQPRVQFSRREPSPPVDHTALRQTRLQEIGAHLSQVRRDRNLSLQEIYAQTFIQVFQLRAIEAGDLRDLPEPFYIHGFIKKYAEALGLRGVEVAASFPID